MACRLLWPYALLCSHSSSSYCWRLRQAGLASSSGLAMLAPVPLQDSKTMAQQQQQEQQMQRACEG